MYRPGSLSVEEALAIAARLNAAEAAGWHKGRETLGEGR